MSESSYNGTILHETEEGYKMISRDELMKMAEKGNFVSVRFLKKNGEERNLVGRLGVKKGVKGTGKVYDDADKNIVTLYEPKNGYRSIRVDSIISVKTNGEEVKNASE